MRLQLIMDRVSPLPDRGGRRLSFLDCKVPWPFSLIETSDRVNWDSLIAKAFIFGVSSQ